MSRLVLTLAILVPSVTFWIAPADAGMPVPDAVCRLPSVMDVMTSQLQTRSYYVRLDPALVQEAPTADRTVMRCGVCALVFMYDTARYGDRALARCEPHAFAVRAVRNGFVVQPAP